MTSTPKTLDRDELEFAIMPIIHKYGEHCAKHGTGYFEHLEKDMQVIHDVAQKVRALYAPEQPDRECFLCRTNVIHMEHQHEESLAGEQPEGDDMKRIKTDPWSIEGLAAELAQYWYKDGKCSTSKGWQACYEEVLANFNQAFQREREADREKLLHQVADELSWRVANGQIEPIGISVEQIMQRLTKPEGEQS